MEEFLRKNGFEKSSRLPEVAAEWYTTLLPRIKYYRTGVMRAFLLHQTDSSQFIKNYYAFGALMKEGEEIVDRIENEISEIYDTYCEDQLHLEAKDVYTLRMREIILGLLDLKASVDAIMDISSSSIKKDNSTLNHYGSVSRCSGLQKLIDEILEYARAVDIVREKRLIGQDVIVENSSFDDVEIEIPIYDVNKNVPEMRMLLNSDLYSDMTCIGNVFTPSIGSLGLEVCKSTSKSCNAELLSEIGISHEKILDASQYLAHYGNIVREEYFYDYGQKISERIGNLMSNFPNQDSRVDNIVDLDVIRFYSDTKSLVRTGFFGKPPEFPHLVCLEYDIDWLFNSENELYDPGEVVFRLFTGSEYTISQVHKLEGIKGSLRFSTTMYESIAPVLASDLDFSLPCPGFINIEVRYVYIGTHPEVKCQINHGKILVPLKNYHEWGDLLCRGLIPVRINERKGVRARIISLPDDLLSCIRLDEFLTLPWDCGGFDEWGDMCDYHADRYWNFKVIGLLLKSITYDPRGCVRYDRKSQYYWLAHAICVAKSWSFRDIQRELGFDTGWPENVVFLGGVDIVSWIILKPEKNLEVSYSRSPSEIKSLLAQCIEAAKAGSIKYANNKHKEKIEYVMFEPLLEDEMHSD